MRTWLPAAIDKKVITASMRSKFPKHVPDSELPTAPLGSLSLGATAADGTVKAVESDSRTAESQMRKTEEGASVGCGANGAGSVGDGKDEREQGTGEAVLEEGAAGGLTSSKSDSNGGKSTSDSHGSNTNNAGSSKDSDSKNANGGTKTQKSKKAVRVDRGGGGGHPPAGGEVTEIDYCGILNRVLPPDVRALAWAPVTEGFSARFSCSDRTYR